MRTKLTATLPVAADCHGARSLPCGAAGVYEGGGATLYTVASPPPAASTCRGGGAARCDERLCGDELYKARQCYTCKARFRTLHHFYAQLCPKCAALNYRMRLATHDLRGRVALLTGCLLYTSPSPRDRQKSRMPSSA